MEVPNKAVDFLKTLRGPQGESPGLKIITVVTTEPNPFTFVFDGTQQALDIDLFEIPVECYPLRKGDRLLVFPLISGLYGQRWAAVVKLNGGVTLAIMQSDTSLKVDGVDKVYGATDLVIPPYFAVSDAYSHYEDYDNDEPTGIKDTSDDYLLKGDIKPLVAGDQVSIAPTWDGSKIKYVILERY